MHVQRIHYSKLVVIALILLSVMLFVLQRGELQANRNIIGNFLSVMSCKAVIIILLS